MRVGARGVRILRDLNRVLMRQPVVHRGRARGCRAREEGVPAVRGKLQLDTKEYE
mgnify:CR=1 FL=1